MPRERRMFARSAFTSKKLKFCTDSEFLLFVHLVVEADDEGRGEGEPCSLEMTAKNRKWSEAKVAAMMEHLAGEGLVYWYTNDGGQYYEVVDFLDYQQGSWHGKSAKPSKIPSLSDSEPLVHHKRWTGTPTMVDGYTDTASNRREVKGIEGKGSGTSAVAEYTPAFETFWNEYPRTRHVPKRKTFNAWLRLLKDGVVDTDLISAARGYKKAMEEEERPVDKMLHPSTFLSFTDRNYEPFIHKPSPLDGKSEEEIRALFRDGRLKRDDQGRMTLDGEVL